METFWGIISLLLVIGFIIAVALIVWMVIGEQSRAEMASMNNEAIRSRLLNYGYFTDKLRATPTLQNFLSQIEKKEEKALASTYLSEKQLYSMLHRAEREASYQGRPECLDYYGEVFDLLRELAKKS